MTVKPQSRQSFCGLRGRMASLGRDNALANGWDAENARRQTTQIGRRTRKEDVHASTRRSTEDLQLHSRHDSACLLSGDMLHVSSKDLTAS